VTFPAQVGVKLRAGALRRNLHTIAYVPTDQAFQADIYSDVAGLSFDVERNARYGFVGYIAYESSSTADIKFTLAGPDGATGHYSFYTQNQAATGGIGNLESLRLDLINDDSQQQGAAGGTGLPMTCYPRGYVATVGVGGAVQVRFAQVTTTAAETVVKAGSWLRAYQLTTINI
jgi:hypothetical protein